MTNLIHTANKRPENYNETFFDIFNDITKEEKENETLYPLK